MKNDCMNIAKNSDSREETPSRKEKELAAIIFRRQIEYMAFNPYSDKEMYQ